MSNRSQRSYIDIDIGIGIDFVMVRRDIKDSSMAGAAASRSLDAGATITALHRSPHGRTHDGPASPFIDHYV